MAGSGTTTVNFGSFPGNAGPVTAVITGQPGIISTSLVAAWIYPVATADHTADEHIVDPPYVIAGNIVAGTGLTIYAESPGYMAQPDAITRLDGPNFPTSSDQYTRPTVSITPMPYGLWTVAWCWN